MLLLRNHVRDNTNIYYVHESVWGFVDEIYMFTVELSQFTPFLSVISLDDN